MKIKDFISNSRSPEEASQEKIKELMIDQIKKSECEKEYQADLAKKIEQSIIKQNEYETSAIDYAFGYYTDDKINEIENDSKKYLKISNTEFENVKNCFNSREKVSFEEITYLVNLQNRVNDVKTVKERVNKRKESLLSNIYDFIYGGNDKER